jgi:hypothetical protein
MHSSMKSAFTALLLAVAFPLLCHAYAQGPLRGPNSVAFSSTQAVGTSSPTQQITLQNITAYWVSISSITVTGDFQQTNDCGNGVNFTHSCTMWVTFTPTAVDTRTGLITIKGKYQSGPNLYPYTETISLSGTGSVTGFINPKYLIVGVTYAPPGPSSNVTYANSTLVGNTTTTTATFTSGENVTVSASTDISPWSIVGGAGVKVKLSESTDYSQTSTTSNEVTISKQADVKDITSGTGNAFSPVNHDYDTIWLWLNPLAVYSIVSSTPGNVQWNGYGYDSNDPSGRGGPDIYGVQVGWLNGHFGPNTSVQQVLARGWVTTNEPRITWPSGEGPGLTGLGAPCPPPPGTNSDICNILAADPFTSSYTLLTSLPSTSSDGRFTQISYPPNPITYGQAGPGNGGGTTTQYDAVYTDTHIVGHGTSHSFTQTFGIDSSFMGGTWFGRWTVEVAVTQTLKWTHDWMSKLTTTDTLTKAFSITGPGCPQTSPPCVPTYSGPGQFIVYQDNQYGTFLVYPSN